jgi:hypothetical protein
LKPLWRPSLFHNSFFPYVEWKNESGQGFHPSSREAEIMDLSFFNLFSPLAFLLTWLLFYASMQIKKPFSIKSGEKIRRISPEESETTASDKNCGIISLFSGHFFSYILFSCYSCQDPPLSPPPLSLLNIFTQTHFHPSRHTHLFIGLSLTHSHSHSLSLSKIRMHIITLPLQQTSFLH